MFSLSGPNGTYPVAATTFLVPVQPSIIVGSAKVPGRDGAGLVLQEVAFTAYYPASISSEQRSKGLRWMSYPPAIEINGYRQFLGGSRWLDWLFIKPIIYLYGQFLKIPIYRNAPLLSLPDKVWPLVIFSHGLGGNRTAYSQFCTRLAASGRVVLALEHRDGTATACLSHSDNQSQVILYINESKVIWETKPDGVMPLRTAQIAIRQHEMYTTFMSFSKLVSGDSNVVISTIEGNDPRKTWSKSPIRLDDICLAGHSFGGCTVLSLLSSHPPENRDYRRMPVKHALVLDPWLDPLPSPGPTPSTRNIDTGVGVVQSSLNDPAEEAPENPAHDLPLLLVINSEEFTCWTEHFQRLIGIVKTWSTTAKLITLVKSQHVSFSDFPLLPIIRRKQSTLLMNIITRLSIAFMGDDLNSALKEENVIDKMPETVVVGQWKDGSDKYRFTGSPGEVVLHQ